MSLLLSHFCLNVCEIHKIETKNQVHDNKAKKIATNLLHEKIITNSVMKVITCENCSFVFCITMVLFFVLAYLKMYLSFCCFHGDSCKNAIVV